MVGSEKNKYFSFLSHSNGPSRVRDSYKASIALYESLEFFKNLSVGRSYHREAYWMINKKKYFSGRS